MLHHRAHPFIVTVALYHRPVFFSAVGLFTIISAIAASETPTPLIPTFRVIYHPLVLRYSPHGI